MQDYLVIRLTNDVAGGLLDESASNGKDARLTKSLRRFFEVHLLEKKNSGIDGSLQKKLKNFMQTCSKLYEQDREEGSKHIDGVFHEWEHVFLKMQIPVKWPYF